MMNASVLGYRRFLVQRDGEADLYRGTLANREQFYRELELAPVRSKWSFDRDVFLRNMARARPEPGLDERMLWLLATAKANQSERFGVELTKLYGRVPPETDDPESVHLVLQETYHTRTLADVVAMFGLPVPQRPPRLATRFFIKLMVFNPLPKPFVLPLVGFAESMGCTLFRLLRDRGVELFADEPKVAERIRLLYDEILADEICHVGFVKARMGRLGRAVMRGLQRWLGVRSQASMAPECLALIGRDRIARELGAELDQRAAAAEFPRTAYAF